MAKIYGEIGSLRYLLEKLLDRGIYSFNTLKDIYEFKINFEENTQKLKQEKIEELTQHQRTKKTS